MAQSRYNASLRNAPVGTLADNGPADVISLIADDPSTAQVSTITVDSASNSTQYDITVQGEALAYTSDSSATTAEIAAGLAAAIKASGVAASGLNVSVASNVVTLTSLYAGATFTVSSDEGDLTVATGTAADQADPLAFGALAIYDSADPKYGKAFRTANLAARTRTITAGGTEEDSLTIAGNVQIGGVSWSFVTNTASSATLTSIGEAIRDAINAVMPANTVIATADTGVVTLTSEVVGVPFEVTAVVYGASTLTITVGGDSYVHGDDAAQVAAGIVLRGYRHEVSASGTANVGGSETADIVRRGRIHVATAEQVAPGKPVYVDLATGASFRASAASGYIELPAYRFRWHDAPSASVGVLDLT